MNHVICPNCKAVFPVEGNSVELNGDALEQAAQLVERYCDSPMIVKIAGDEAAKAIRALKG